DALLEPAQDTGCRLIENREQPGATDLPFRFRDKFPNEPATAPRRDPAKASLAGLFRGQVIGATTSVGLHRVPEVVVFEQGPPPVAGIAVRAPDAVHQRFAPGTGAIAIALDCSGSMLE